AIFPPVLPSLLVHRTGCLEEMSKESRAWILAVLESRPSKYIHMDLKTMELSANLRYFDTKGSQLQPRQTVDREGDLRLPVGCSALQAAVARKDYFPTSRISTRNSS